MFAKRTRWIKTRSNKVKKNRITSAATDGLLRFIPSNAQNIGARNNQEDDFAFSDLGNHEMIKAHGFLAIVADGMGGLDFGEEASRAAVSAFINEYQHGLERDRIDSRLLNAITIANTAVYDLAFSSGKELDLGTTLVATVIYKDCLYWISAGDSRIYLFRDHQLQQLTVDHIYANHLQADVDLGKISQTDAELHPERSYLTSYLGLQQLSEISRSNEPLPLQYGDIILLCTDGLHDTLSIDEMNAVLSSDNNDVAGQLVNAALLKNNPHQDNITVAALSVVGN